MIKRTLLFLIPMLLVFSSNVGAEAMEVEITGIGGDDAVSLMVLVALMSLAAPLFLSVTHFTYVVIVLSMTRQALGTQNLPPNPIMISLALFISIYVMFPVLNEVYEQAWIPLQEEGIEVSEALEIAQEPLKTYMMEHTYEKDLNMIVAMTGEDYHQIEGSSDVSFFAAVPSFLLTQIQKGLLTGMMIYFGFAFIDMVVGALLMYMGMMMLPPLILSLPFKLLVFIYLGGYSRITELLFVSVL